MRVTISAITFDPIGVLSIRALPSSDTGKLTRRVSRTATLDLGVAINDRGFSHGDRTMTFEWVASKQTNDTAAYLTRMHGRVQVAMGEGVFAAVIQDCITGRTESSITLLVTERLGP